MVAGADGEKKCGTSKKSKTRTPTFLRSQNSTSIKAAKRAQHKTEKAEGQIPFRAITNRKNGGRGKKR